MKNNLRIRLAKSLAFGLLIYLFITFGFKFVNNGDQVDGLPKVLRSGVDLNAKVASALFPPQRLSVLLPPPQMGTKPRVNGDIGLLSPVNLDDYKIKVGEEKFFEVSVSDLKKLPQVSVSTLFKCVEGWSMPVQYKGVRFSDFIEKYGVGKKSDGSLYKYVGFETPDKEYYVSLDMQSMLHPQTLLALEMNESSLSVENGAPVRLLIPIKYGIKSLKRVGRIFFSDERPPDYWAEQGYDWYAGL